MDFGHWPQIVYSTDDRFLSLLINRVLGSVRRVYPHKESFFSRSAQNVFRAKSLNGRPVGRTRAHTHTSCAAAGARHTVVRLGISRPIGRVGTIAFCQNKRFFLRETTNALRFPTIALLLLLLTSLYYRNISRFTNRKPRRGNRVQCAYCIIYDMSVYHCGITRIYSVALRRIRGGLTGDSA